MRPAWTYNVEPEQVWRSGLRVWAFVLLRNDGKKIGSFQTLGQAQAVKVKFAAWARKPWGKENY